MDSGIGGGGTRTFPLLIWVADHWFPLNLCFVTWVGVESGGRCLCFTDSVLVDERAAKSIAGLVAVISQAVHVPYLSLIPCVMSPCCR